MIKQALDAMDKATPEKWYRQETMQPGEGIRTKNGFICFMFNPSRFPGQDERYAQEMARANADADLIAAAPDMAAWIKKALPYMKFARACVGAGLISTNKAYDEKELGALIKEATE